MSTRLLALLLAASLYGCKSSSEESAEGKASGEAFAESTNPMVRTRIQARVDYIRSRGARPSSPTSSAWRHTASRRSRSASRA